MLREEVPDDLVRIDVPADATDQKLRRILRPAGVDLRREVQVVGSEDSVELQRAVQGLKVARAG